METMDNLRLRSHVGRDLLQSASSFKNEATAVWEYVVNSLQYTDRGIQPKVLVEVKPKAKNIEIKDNGRGMDYEGLKHYFTMHGENIERRLGRPGRGKFGTGKSAAFGIGKILRIETRQNGIQNIVELHRDDIEKTSGEEIELRWISKNEKTDLPNGTNIRIEDIFLPKINTSNIIEYIERHLQAFRTLMPEVAVNEHICEYREPNFTETHYFRPSLKQSDVIGNIELMIKVSSSPLAPEEQGIFITAGAGNLIARETAGIEKKELGNYLYGEVDVPTIESYKTPIEPFDLTRSLLLNPQHPVALVLIPFIGSKLDEVRRIQLKKLNEARKTEEARRLANEAGKIAEILNRDFKEVMGKLQDIKIAISRPGSISSSFGDSSETGDSGGAWVEGVNLPGELDAPQNKPNRNTPKSHERIGDDPQITRSGTPKPEGNELLDPIGESGKKRTKPSGGFRVEYRNLGETSERSKYDRENLTILINLDHPVLINSMRNGSIEDTAFRRLSFEIAFSEYSMALGYEMAEQDPDMPADDLLFEVRSTLNRITTSAAELYA